MTNIRRTTRRPATSLFAAAGAAALTLTLAACGGGGDAASDASETASEPAAAETTSEPAGAETTAEETTEPAEGGEGSATTSDGAASFDLPEGWTDKTEELRAMAEQSQGSFGDAQTNYLFGAMPEGSSESAPEGALMVLSMTPAQEVADIKAQAEADATVEVTSHDVEVDGEPGVVLSFLADPNTPESAVDNLFVNHGDASYLATVVAGQGQSPDQVSAELTALIDSWSWNN